MITIMSAEEKRVQFEAIQVRKAIEAEIEKQETEKRIQSMVEQTVSAIAKMIEAEENYRFMEYVLYCKDTHCCHSCDEIKEAMNRVKDIISACGYEIYDFYTYSQSWQTRSGKYGYFTIKF